MAVSRKDLHNAVARMMRNNSRAVKSMGDNVGPNDMALANKLWAVSADLQEYAKRWEAADAE